MATSARFFEVQLRNGHGIYTIMFPAQSRADLDLNLQIPFNEALISIKNRNFFPVETWPDEENNTVKFRAAIDGTWWRYWLGSPGYAYLLRQFSANAKDIFSEFDKRYPGDE